MNTDEEYAFFSEMLQNNGGCQLPCWWGFSPGETPWEATKTFFVSRGQALFQGDDDTQNYTVIFDIPGHYTSYQSYIGEDDLLDMIGVHAVPPVGEDGDYVYGDVQFAKDWDSYLLFRILGTYGQPSQVLVGIDRDTPWIPFDLLLFYPENGILVRYSGPIAQQEGDTVFHVCPYQAEISLWLWSPECDRTLDQIPGIGGYTADSVLDFLSLEAATGMSIEQFYQIFVQPGNQVCLEIPISKW